MNAIYTSPINLTDELGTRWRALYQLPENKGEIVVSEEKTDSQRQTIALALKFGNVWSREILILADYDSGDGKVILNTP